MAVPTPLKGEDTINRSFSGSIVEVSEDDPDPETVLHQPEEVHPISQIEGPELL